MKMKKYLAESIGTMVLTGMGCGSAMLLGCTTPGGHLAVALAFGLSIVAMAYVIGNVSGCHLNPAVSLAMLLTKKLDAGDFCGYVAAQTLGALVGASILRLMTSGFGVIDQTGALGANAVAGAGGVLGAAIAEILLTFIFIFTILGVTSKPGNSSVAGIVIGLTLTFVHIVGIPLTGTSVNPARSIGPAVLAGGDALGNLPVFVLAPLAGAALAAVLFKVLQPEDGI